jgi:hypothetical protein
MRRNPVLPALGILLLTSAAFAVEGDWHGDAASALADARKTKRPVLAVAMDHG